MLHIGRIIRNCITHLGGNKQNLFVKNAITCAFLTATALTKLQHNFRMCFFQSNKHSFWMEGVCCYFCFFLLFTKIMYFFVMKKQVNLPFLGAVNSCIVSSHAYSPRNEQVLMKKNWVSEMLCPLVYKCRLAICRKPSKPGLFKVFTAWLKL